MHILLPHPTCTEAIQIHEHIVLAYQNKWYHNPEDQTANLIQSIRSSAVQSAALNHMQNNLSFTEWHSFTLNNLYWNYALTDILVKAYGWVISLCVTLTIKVHITNKFRLSCLLVMNSGDTNINYTCTRLHHISSDQVWHTWNKGSKHSLEPWRHKES